MACVACIQRNSAAPRIACIVDCSIPAKKAEDPEAADVDRELIMH